MKTKEHLLLRAFPYLFAGAALTALTLIFPVLGWAEWMTMIPLFIGAYRLCGHTGIRLRTVYLFGFLTVLIYYLLLYHWFIRLYPLDFVGMSNGASVAVILAGWLGLSLLQAIPGGLVFLLFAALHRTPVIRRAPLLRPFLFSALWVVFEWSATLSWLGVPWGRLCLGQIRYLPLLQSASLFGSSFVSFLLLTVNGLLAYALLYRKKWQRSALCVSVAVLLFASNWIFGAAALHRPAKEYTAVRVATLQGNINSHDKWSADSLRLTKEIYGEMTRKAAKEGAELILWPETAFPYVLNRSAGLSEYVSGLAKEYNVTLVIGALYKDSLDREYNALYLISPDGTVSDHIYAKRHLVPFGEYVPMRKLITTLIPPLADLSALDSDLTAGTDPALFETKWGSAGGLICFDSIYDGLARDSVRSGAGILLLSSNDSWFYDSAAVYQHQAQAQLRAIETGRYLVRSGNTGISSVITDHGENIAWIDPLTDGYAVSDVRFIPTQNTLYTVVGNLFVCLCILFFAATLGTGILLSVRERKRTAPGQTSR